MEAVIAQSIECLRVHSFLGVIGDFLDLVWSLRVALHAGHIAQDYETTKVKLSMLTSGVTEEVPRVKS